MNDLGQISPRASKTSTPDTNKLDRTKLTDISCLKCLTSLGYTDSNQNLKSNQNTHHNTTTFYFHLNPSINPPKPRKRQTIKLQDCSTWLALTNKASYESQYGSKANTPGVTGNRIEVGTSMHLVGFKELPIQDKRTYAASYDKNYERINMLINRKNTRAMT